MSEVQSPPIGGYFELELPARRELPHAGLQHYQSARAAFLALLRVGRPTRVWMPRYICNAMLTPLENVGIEYAWYDLTDELEVGPEVRLDAGDWLLYVNYFGVCGAKVEALLHRFSPAQIVLDFSQAFFSPTSKLSLPFTHQENSLEFRMADCFIARSQYPHLRRSISIHLPERSI